MAEKDDTFPSESKRSPLGVFFKDSRLVFKMDELGLEIARIALPAALALTTDPIVSLVDTAFIGQIGPVELAAVGVSIALFNQASRIAIFPLVSVTTSFVAEEDTVAKASPEAQESKNLEMGSIINNENEKLIPQNESEESKYKTETLRGSVDVAVFKHEKRKIPSASSALIIGGILGLLQAMFLISGAQLRFPNVKACTTVLDIEITWCTCSSTLIGHARGLLRIKGHKDTSPCHCGRRYNKYNFGPNIHLCFPSRCQWCCNCPCYFSVPISIVLLWRLMEQVDLIPPSLKYLQIGRFLKNGFLLLMRIMAVTFCVTLSASLAAHQGPATMATFQVRLQVWLVTSLLADELAVAGQAILASAFARNDYNRATATASRMLQLGLVLGLVLAVILGVGLQFGARLFTKDVNVLHLISIGTPFVAATQPLNF